jgi:hypothetical protein
MGAKGKLEVVEVLRDFVWEAHQGDATVGHLPGNRRKMPLLVGEAHQGDATVKLGILRLVTCESLASPSATTNFSTSANEACCLLLKKPGGQKRETREREEGERRERERS